MSEILFPEFRDEQEKTKYPFADSATLTSVDGFSLEVDTFLDASLYPVGGAARTYLSSVTVSTRSVVLTIGEPRNRNLATVEFDPLDPPDILSFSDAYDRPAGVLVSESVRLAIFQSWPEGEHRFNAEATEFVASCVVPMPQDGLRGIATEDGNLLTGDVWLYGENGVVLRGDGDGNIRVDVVGDPLYRRKLCDPLSLFTTPRFIRTINGMPPNESGDFKITVGSHAASDTILRIYPDADGLRIETVGPTVQGGV